MYNVNSYTANNIFTVVRTNSDGVSSPYNIIITIPYGNYDVYSFCSQLNTLCSTFMTVSYNIPQNSYTFTKTDVSGFRYFIYFNTCSKLLGISNNNTEILLTGTNGTYVNMLNYNKIILRVKNLQFEYFSFENIIDPDSTINNSDIMFWINKADVAPFKQIVYDNMDGGNSFNFLLFNNVVDYLQLKLYNENNEILYDAPDYLLGLQFILEDDDSYIVVNHIGKILKFVEEIYDTILMYLRFIKFM